MDDNKFKKHDVFHSYLVKDATYAGKIELPIISKNDYRIWRGTEICFSKIQRYGHQYHLF